MTKINQKQIDTFFAQKSIAFIGLSRNPQDFSRNVLKEFISRDYNIIPVNPNSTEIEGKKCYASIKDVKEPVDAAIIFVPSANRGDIPKECIEKGIRNIWIYDDKAGNMNTGNIDESNKENLNIITGYCPLMFIPGTHWFHKMHGFFVKLSGKYPA